MAADVPMVSLRVSGLLVGMQQRSGARPHLVPTEPYAAALCGVATDYTRDRIPAAEVRRLCDKCFKAWAAPRDAAGLPSSGAALWAPDGVL